MIEALLALCFLIFFHELGHFLVAKYFGVFVEVFSIGFGPKICSVQLGETKYAISAIPLGGYVKLKGQDDLHPLHKDFADDSFSTKPAYQKMLILFAGPFFNLLLAFLIYIAVGSMGIKTLSPQIDTPKENSPASLAKLQKGDTILSIDDVEIHSWEDIAQAISNSQKPQSKSNADSTNSALTPLRFLIKRESQTFEAIITPQMSPTKNIFNEKITRPIVGIMPSGEVFERKFSLSELVIFAFEECKKSSTLIFEGVKKLIIGTIPLGEVGGVVGIVNVMADIAPSGFVAFGLLVALISINLAILNLLPIPALDGGQMLIIIYEAISKKPINERVLYLITTAGWALLLGLMLLGLYNDFSRIFPESLKSLPRIEP